MKKPGSLSAAGPVLKPAYFAAAGAVVVSFSRMAMACSTTGARKRQDPSPGRAVRI
jgi:hypothetical protein